MAVAEVRSLPLVAMVADLERSGIDEKDAKRLKLAPLTSAKTQELCRNAKVPSYRIPYLSVDGKPTDFWRLRFLADAGGSLAGRRYFQPADTPPRAYFAPVIDWSEVARDATKPLYITEGEKKAAAMCIAGFPCVGLGGVWSWRSTRLRQPLIPDLLQLSWSKRAVILCFDGEPEDRPDLEGALEALGGALQQKGAIVKALHLPLLNPEQKCGADDFLVARGAKAFASLPVDDLASAAELSRLNEELAVVAEPPAVLHLGSGRLFSSPRTLIDVLYADRRVPTVDAAGRMREVSAVAEWLKWPHRRRYAGLAYEPGRLGALPDGSFNQWRGLGVEPRRGDVGPWRRLLDHVMAGAEPAHRAWFERWLAYPLQHQGTKLYTAVVLWSRANGAGKSLVGLTMGKLYGGNFSKIGEQDLHSAFNDWQVNKQFILGDEVTGSDRRAEADKLKSIITDDRALINRKYEVPYWVRLCANYLFTSNHGDSFMLDEQDRRLFIHEVLAGVMPADLVREYDAWYKSEDGQRALLHHLLHLDLGDFHPLGRAPTTEAKMHMASLSGGEADELARSLLDAPGRYLRVGDEEVARDLFTLDEILALVDPSGRLRVGPRQLARALRRAGVPQAYPTNVAGGKARLWAVRNGAKWSKATHEQRQAHYAGVPAVEKKQKF